MTALYRPVAVAAAIALCATSAAAAEKRFGLTSFESIEVAADVDVVVTARAPVSGVATGSQDALDRLSVEAQDGRLVIKMRQFAGDDERRRGGDPVTLRVNAANLRSAMVAGAGSLDIDTLRGDRVTIGLRGPGRLRVHPAGDRLEEGLTPHCRSRRHGGNGGGCVDGAQHQQRLPGASAIVSKGRKQGEG